MATPIAKPAIATTASIRANGSGSAMAANETALVSTLLSLKKRGAAVLVVSHRKGILSAVDKILVMKDGRVELFGPRDEVLARLSAPAPVVQIRKSETGTSR
jgi:ABC-type protease/lipase transport system fused ATPase/permease subunit